MRANAALLLGKSGKQEGIRYLYWTLQRSDSADKVVLQAAEAIAMLRDKRIYEPLWTRLISAYADDRVIGISAMGALGTEEARNALITMLDDPVPEVRLAAAEQLGRLGDPIGEPEVLEVIEKNLVAGMDPQGRERVKMLTALAIGEIATPVRDSSICPPCCGIPPRRSVWRPPRRSCDPPGEPAHRPPIRPVSPRIRPRSPRLQPFLSGLFRKNDLTFGGRKRKIMACRCNIGTWARMHGPSSF